MQRPADRLARAAGVILPPIALIAAAGLYFREVLPLPEPRWFFGGDFASYFYPVYRYVAEEIAAGRLPHWSPYVGAGYPLLSDIEASVLYPPIRLLTLVTGPPSYRALELYAIAHFVLAGLGMLVLGREMGLAVGVNLPDAIWGLVVIPLLGLPFGVMGAAAGRRLRGRPPGATSLAENHR